MNFINLGKMLACAALAYTSLAFSPTPADAGQFSKIIAIVVATDDGEAVTIPVKAVDVDLKQAMAIKTQIASNPFRQTSTTTTCVDGSCPTGTVCVDGACTPASAANCPCDCPDCNCGPPTSTATTTTTTTYTAYGSHASHGEGIFRGGPLRRLAGFVVKGGPIRQALRANRRSRRGG